MRLFAHRGSHRDHAENTHAAFATAIAEGADGVELDVRLCRSGEVLVAHDADLMRLAGDPVQIALAPYGRLARVDLGAGERVPLLDAVIDQVVGAGLELNVEIKGDVPDRRACADAVSARLGRRAAAEREAFVVSTFDPWVLWRTRARLPDVRSALLFDASHTGARRAAFLTRALRPQGVHPHHALCTAEAVRGWRERGLFVNAWTVNDPDEARRLAALRLDVAITDDVPRMRAALRP